MTQHDRSEPQTAQSRTAKQHRAQVWTEEVWHREKVQGADYNPRYMDASTRRRLREGIQDFGLLAPITVNSRTGNIIGGHQRLDALDALDNSGGNYTLKVAVVDMSPEQERAANILLNNQNAQGQFDFSKLQQMFEDGTSPFASGFEQLDLEMEYGEDFALAMQRRYKEQEALSAEEQQRVDQQFETDPDHQAKVEAEIALIKQRKADYLQKARSSGRPDFNLIITFPSAEELEEWIEGMGYDITLRALPADDFQDRLLEWAYQEVVLSELDERELGLAPLLPLMAEYAGEDLTADNLGPLLKKLMADYFSTLDAPVMTAALDDYAQQIAAQEALDEGDEPEEGSEGGEEASTTPDTTPDATAPAAS